MRRRCRWPTGGMRRRTASPPSGSGWAIPNITQRCNARLNGLDLPALGIPTEEQYVASYCERTGRDGIENWDFYAAYNMFRLAAILQGIVGRVKDGTASNKNAADVAVRVKPLAIRGWEQAEKIIKGA